MKYTIDAQDKRLGRVATEAATYLMGKNTASYQRNIAPDVTVEITNASKLAIDARKQDQKLYSRYSGYPSGLKQERLGHRRERKGVASIVESAVYGMLPANRLRSRMMKNLTINE